MEIDCMLAEGREGVLHVTGGHMQQGHLAW